MRKHDLTRTIIESTVDRALRDMEKDAHRSVRNLVDLALTFSKGRFERHFLEICRRMLENEGSPYYTALDRALERVDRQTLKIFGVNLGYEGCSKGARRIRETEAQAGFNVPWALTMFAGREGLSRIYIQRMISEGTALGVHVYLLVDRGLPGPELEQLLQDNKTCAFVVFTSGTRSADWDLSRLRCQHNLMVSVAADQPLALELCQALAEERMLYAVHRQYNDQSAQQVLEPAQMEELEALGPLFVLLYPGEAADQQVRRTVYRQVADCRSAQTYPFGLIELSEDLLVIDQIISDGPCSLAFLPDGQAATPQGVLDGPGFNIRTTPLPAILRAALPKPPAPEATEPPRFGG